MYWGLFLGLKYCPVPFCRPYSVGHTGKANPEFLALLEFDLVADDKH